MSKIFVNDEMLSTKGSIDTVHFELTSILKEINTQLDLISNSWTGKKSTEVLKGKEEIKTQNDKLLERIKIKSKQILDAYNKYVEYEDTDIKETVAVDSSEIKPEDTSIKEPIVTDSKEIEIKDTSSLKTSEEKLKALSTNFSGFHNTLLPLLIQNEKNGTNSFSAYSQEELINLIKSYNASANITNVKQDSYLQDSANSLNMIQEELKKNNLWGTPSAARIVSLWMMNTGYRIPTTASIATDSSGRLVEGIGNQRGVGIGNNWESSGLDCTNFSYWLTLNSGLLTDSSGAPSEGMVLNNPYNVGSKLTESNVVNFSAGDIVSREDHVGVYLFSDDKYIYTFETVSTPAQKGPRKGLGDSGTTITVVPINNSVTVPSDFYGPSYPNGYWKRITNIENVSLSKPKVPHTGNIVLKPNN